MTDDRNDGLDPELERTMRAGLERQAARVDTTAPVAERAAAAARRRRRGRLAAGAAALAVAAVTVTGVVIDRTGAPGGDEPVIVDRIHEPMPTEWRTEYWRDLQVDVPADWGWGGAPQPGFASGDGILWCAGPGAILDSSGTRLREQDPTMAYVGRPVLQSDLCMSGIEDETPQAPYVWLGAPIEPGSVDLGGGYVRETREVNGSTVSVATRDAELRERILDSAAGGETCFSELESAPRPTESAGTEGSAGIHPESLTVCAYRDEADSGTLGLTYAAVLDRARARALLDAVEGAPPSAHACGEQPGWEYAVLRVEGTGPTGDEPLFREYVVDFACEAVRAPGGGGQVALTRATADPWAAGGIGVSLTGSAGADGSLAGYFIGMQG